MLTIDNLRAFGADVDDGLVRCLNRSEFYLMLVGKVKEDKPLPQLEMQLAAKDYDAAFETAHTLKGMYSNLSLTPLTQPVSEMTEMLRSRKDTDYSALMQELKTQFDKLCAL